MITLEIPSGGAFLLHHVGWSNREWCIMCIQEFVDAIVRMYCRSFVGKRSQAGYILVWPVWLLARKLVKSGLNNYIQFDMLASENANISCNSSLPLPGCNFTYFVPDVPQNSICFSFKGKESDFHLNHVNMQRKLRESIPSFEVHPGTFSEIRKRMNDIY